MPDKPRVPDNERPLLSRGKRRWAWIGLIALCAHGVFVAYETHDDTWTLSITVAVGLAMVILIDDRRRHPTRHRALGPSMSESSQPDSSEPNSSEPNSSDTDVSMSDEPVAAASAATAEGRDADPR